MSKKGRPIQAAKWGLLLSVSKYLLQMVVLIILARLLGPDNYGVFVISTVVFGLLTIVTNFGFCWRLLYKEDMTDADVRFAFTWQCISGILGCCAVLLGAEFVADWFNKPESAFAIRWIALTAFLFSVSRVSHAMLRREMRYRAEGSITLLAYTAGYVCVGLPMALTGAGAEALVSAWVVQHIAQLVLLYSQVRHPLRPLFRHPDGTAARRNGVAVFCTNLINWTLNNFDKMLIGKLLPASHIGLYNAGYNLASMPNSLSLSIVQPLFLSSTRTIGSVTDMRAAYEEVMGVILIYILPGFVAFSLVAPDLVALIYGDAWQQTGEVLSVLLLAMPMLAMVAMSTPVFWKYGKDFSESLLQLPLVVIGCVGMFYMIDADGLIGAAFMFVTIAFLRMIVIVWRTGCILNMARFWYLKDLSKGLVLSGVMLWASAVTPLKGVLHIGTMALLMLMLYGVLVVYLPALSGKGIYRVIRRNG